MTNWRMVPAEPCWTRSNWESYCRISPLVRPAGPSAPGRERARALSCPIAIPRRAGAPRRDQLERRRRRVCGAHPRSGRMACDSETEGAGQFTLMFLPPRSPELNPVELDRLGTPADLGEVLPHRLGIAIGQDKGKALTLLHRKLPPPREECEKPLQLLTPMAACRSVRRQL